MPTLKAIWGPKGQQVMIPTPAQPKKRYGIGAVDYHTGEMVVLIRRRKRRREIAELLEALLEKHPTGKVYVAWDNSNTHEDEEVEAVLRGAAGRLVVLYVTSCRLGPPVVVGEIPDRLGLLKQLLATLHQRLL